MLNSIRSSLVALLILSFSAAATAATTVPYTFTTGTPISASEMNANFQALATAIDKLSSTTPTVAELAGTYRLTGFQTELGPSPSTSWGLTKVETYGGTVTLSADGTCSSSGAFMSGTLTARVDNTNITNSTVFSLANASGPLATSCTWSIVGGNTISVSWGGVFSIVAGGRLLVDTHSVASVPGSHGATSSIIILTRQ